MLRRRRAGLAQRDFRQAADGIGKEIAGKKLEIVKYAFDPFYTDDFHATGTEAALAGSGISKRALYNYFSSKEDLIEAVLRLYSENIARELFEPVKYIDDPQANHRLL
jgi:AcrR family transcriptional regulator